MKGERRKTGQKAGGARFLEPKLNGQKHALTSGFV